MRRKIIKKDGKYVLLKMMHSFYLRLYGFKHMVKDQRD